MKKKLLTIAVVFLALPLFVGGRVFAEGKVLNSSQASTGTNQQRNVIKINSFSINGTVANVKFSVNRNLINEYVKYSVALEKIIDKDENITSGFMVDKVYIPEKDIALINSGREYSFSHNFGYLVPANYRVVIRMENLAGNPIALVSSDDVKVNTNNKDKLIIDNFSCQIHISEDEYDRTYGLYDGPDVTPEEHLVMFCDVINNPHIQGNLKVRYSIFDRKGQEIKKGFESEDVVLQGDDKERIAVEIPIVKKPQVYNAEISLQTTDGQETNKVKAHYVVQGVSGTIQDVDVSNLESISKDKQIKLTVQLSGRTDYFVGSRTLEKDNKIQQTQSTVEAEAIDSTGKTCGNVKKDIVLTGDIKTINLDLPIKNNCYPEKVKIRLLDSNGNKLDETVVSIFQNVTGISQQKKNGGFNDNKSHFNNKVLTFVFGGLLAIIFIGFFAFIVFKKKGVSMLFFVISASLFYWGVVNVVHVSAVTLMVPPPSVWDGLGKMPLVITPDVSGCQSAKLDFDATVKSCSNSMQSRMEISYKGESGGENLIKTAYSKCNDEKKMHNVKQKDCSGSNKAWKGKACWKTMTRSEKEKFCVAPDRTNNATTFSYNGVPSSVGVHRIAIYAQFFPDPHSGNNSNQGPKVNTPVDYTVLSCPKCTPGTLSVGSKKCPDANTGLIKDIAWHKSTDDCNTDTKCAYTKKAECGPANTHDYETQDDLIKDDLCKPGFIPSEFTNKPIELGDDEGNFDGRWEWTCNKDGYDPSDTCWARKRGQCNSNTSGDITMSSACTAGKVNSINFNSGTLNWSCGTVDADPPVAQSLLYNKQSIQGYNFDVNAMITDSVAKHTDNLKCACTPQYIYTCPVTTQANCSAHCGSSAEEVHTSFKRDVHCFTGKSTGYFTTKQDYASHIPQHDSDEPTTCTNKSVTCPPCGATNGGSDTINETN